MFGKILSIIFPWLIPLIIILVTLPLDFTYKIKNFDGVLNSVITFSSIIVGFLGALLGILITIKNTRIIKEIKDNNEMNTLRYYFNEALILGFIVVIMSIIFQVLKDYHFAFVLYFFYIWFVFSAAFTLSSFRIIKLLMKTFFKSDESEERPSSNVDSINKEEREKMKTELTKTK